MAKKVYRSYVLSDQSLLLPPSLRDWLPKNHPAWFLSDVVESLDLSPIYQVYEAESRGKPPYHPAMMLKVLIYAYSTGVYSSRKIERRLQDDIAFRVLSGNTQPDFRTISDFRKRHLEAFRHLFLQVLTICKRAGLVRLGNVALDGTKIKANASKHKAMSYQRMLEETERLQNEIEALTQKAQEADAAEDRELGANRRQEDLPRELAFREQRLATIRAAKEALEAEARQRDQRPSTAAADPEKPDPGGQGGKRRRKRPPGTPEPKAQRNFTDPDSRIMKGSDKQFLQGYNAQAAVDARSQVIVAADVTNQAADTPHLVPMVKQVVANVGRKPKRVAADAGFYSETNVTTLQGSHIDPHIPPGKQRHRQRRQPRAPRGRIPKKATLADRMRRKLLTKAGARYYRQREQSIEPVFGQIKQGRGFRQFSLRGLAKVQGEWHLVCLAHNLRKLFAARAAA